MFSVAHEAVEGAPDLRAGSGSGRTGPHSGLHPVHEVRQTRRGHQISQSSLQAGPRGQTVGWLHLLLAMLHNL